MIEETGAADFLKGARAAALKGEKAKPGGMTKKKMEQQLRSLVYRHGESEVIMAIASFLKGEKAAEFVAFVEERNSEPGDNWEEELDSLA